MSDDADHKRSRLDSVIPGILKRAVEKGAQKAQEAPDNLRSFVGDLKVPKELAHYLFAQVDETKNGLFRVVAKEMRDFLEHTNFSGEIQRLLTTVQFEVNTTIRFRPNNGEKDTAEGDDDREGDADETGNAEPESDPKGSAAHAAPESSGPRRAEARSEGPRSSDVPRADLPKPEVSTQVRVHRAGQRRRRRRPPPTTEE
jgi:hypothetical protein